MAMFDLPLSELESYRPEVQVPEDFDEFWRSTLDEARSFDLGLRLERESAPLRHVEAYDVTFAGFGGHPIKAWYTRPAGVSEPLPAVVNYIGYGSGRGLPWDHTLFPSAGYAFLRMDNRAQGWSPLWRGDTPDPVGHGPAVPGVMTRGLEGPHTYYYRRLFTDAVRAVDAARALPGVDPGQVVVSGVSQGGAMAIAAAALEPEVRAMLADVPFMQHVRRAVELVDTAPYSEVRAYLMAQRDAVERTWHTLSYFDGVSLAARGSAPSLWSVALMDQTCPPSTVYASYNRYRGEKSIEVYPYNGHEGGGPAQVGRWLTWLADLLG